MPDSEFLHIIGERIRALRKSKKMNQLDLSFEAGIHTTYLSDIERGAVNPSISVLYSIAKALDVKLSEIFCDIPEESKQDWQIEGEIFEFFAEYRKLSTPKRKIVFHTLKGLFTGLSEVSIG
ncbi:hypothetical protein DRQ26_07210 [bacterium]|nr:MAG: hypothetical protein DRQ26_07210 [bacterium]